LIKSFRQLKGYTATHFLREFRTKNWTRAQILTILKRTVITYNSLNKRYLVYCVLRKSFASLLETYNYSVMSQFGKSAFNTVVH